MKSALETKARGVAGEAAAFQAPVIEELAKYFPQLDLIALMGHGGMGAV